MSGDKKLIVRVGPTYVFFIALLSGGWCLAAFHRPLLLVCTGFAAIGVIELPF